MITKDLEELIKEGTGCKLVTCTIEYKGIDITFERGGKYVMFAKGLNQKTILSNTLNNEEDILGVIEKFV